MGKVIETPTAPRLEVRWAVNNLISPRLLSQLFTMFCALVLSIFQNQQTSCGFIVTSRGPGAPSVGFSYKVQSLDFKVLIFCCRHLFPAFPYPIRDTSSRFQNTVKILKETLIKRSSFNQKGFGYVILRSSFRLLKMLITFQQRLNHRNSDKRVCLDKSCGDKGVMKKESHQNLMRKGLHT